MNKDIRSHTSKSLDVLRGAPGAREQVAVVAVAIALFLAMIILASVVLLNTIDLGDYGALQVQHWFYGVVILWLSISLLLALGAVKLSLMISERVSGPVKRMERLLDQALQNEDVSIVLRENDALFGIACKINKLLESRKDIT